MFGECHEHIFMDGTDYLAAVKTHKNGPCEPVIRAHLLEYQKRGVTYIRDGGDKYGASVLYLEFINWDSMGKLWVSVFPI